MSMVLYALGVWLLASVPVAVVLGSMCSVNELWRDGGERPSPKPHARMMGAVLSRAA